MLRWLIAPILLATPLFAGTIVEIRTPIGAVALELYDEVKPVTVDNFLHYVSSGRYENSFAHRLDPGFVLQGGGFTLNGNTIDHVPTFGAIQNEYSTGQTFSNLYGTIAMARVGGQVNSATSQWFINLGNNAFLDAVDEGFTVFGHVISGFDVLERLNTTFDDENFEADLVADVREDLGSTFGELPLLYPALKSDALLFTEIVVVPEPGTLTLFGAACFGVSIFFTRARAKRRGGDAVPRRRVPARDRDGSIR